MEFKKYPKIYGLMNSDWTERDETKWILNWYCFVQEKIDWANLSVWVNNWEIRVGSRNQDVTTQSFRWAVEYITNHKGIKTLLDTLEWDIRLYWEWLVPHTITNYNPEAYNHFYMFDIEVDDCLLDTDRVTELAEDYWIRYPKIIYSWENITMEQLNNALLFCSIWTDGEWIVIKNKDYVNEWGENHYAKIVSERFKEDNWVIFWNHSKWDNELKICNKYCTLWRVRKIINKIEQDNDIDINKKHIREIIWKLYHDIITEEIWNIQKEWTIDFKRLKWIIDKRWARISIDLIEWNIQSIAYDE